MNRWISALIVFVFLAVAISVAVSIDYTDKYVADRFYKAFAADQYEMDSPFSLDAFLEYYDWDEVCITTPDMEQPSLKTQLGLPFTHRRDGDTDWSLILVKSYYVTAEIHVKRGMLEYPRDLEQGCFDRWASIVEIVEEDGVKRMRFVGD